MQAEGLSPRDAPGWRPCPFPDWVPSGRYTQMLEARPSAPRRGVWDASYGLQSWDLAGNRGLYEKGGKLEGTCKQLQVWGWEGAEIIQEAENDPKDINVISTLHYSRCFS